MKLISTAYRQRLSKELSYPLGAELLSEAFSGVPQYPDLFIEFHGRWNGTPAEVRRLAREGHDLPVFKASYVDFTKLYGEERWKLQVYPVPSEDKSRTRQAIIEHALPKVRSWLKRFEDSDLLKRGSKHCLVIINLKDCRVKVEQWNVTAG